ncbi:hypothetical protein J7L01_03420, partial [bacterium]|nr:hypothetical protein [bacterium]
GKWRWVGVFAVEIMCSIIQSTVAKTVTAGGRWENSPIHRYSFIEYRNVLKPLKGLRGKCLKALTLKADIAEACKDFIYLAQW